LGFFALFLTCGVLVFPLAANYFSVYPTNTSTMYKAALPVLFLSISYLLRRSDNLQDYRRITYAFFVASTANLMVWLGGTWLPQLVVFTPLPLTDLALNKLSEATVAIATILVLTRLAGRWRIFTCGVATSGWG
jgi:hypothetical protein